MGGPGDCKPRQGPNQAVAGFWQSAGGHTKVESDLNPPFAGFWQSTFAQHLPHGEPDKNVVHQHAPVCHRQVRVQHDIFTDGGPMATERRGKGRTEAWLEFRNLQGDTNFESGLNPGFAQFVSSIFAHHLHQGQSQKNVVHQHAPVCHRQVRVQHDIFPDGEPHGD